MKQITDYPLSPEVLQRMEERRNALIERSKYPPYWSREAVKKDMLARVCRQAEAEFPTRGKVWAFDLTVSELFEIRTEEEVKEESLIPGGAALAARQRKWGEELLIRQWAKKWQEKATIIAEIF